MSDYRQGRYSKMVRQTNLPSPSTVIHHLLDLICADDLDVNDIIDALQGDATLIAKILRSANSAMSSPVSEIDNLKDAINRIGLIRTVQIITATEAARIFYSVPLPYGDICRLWEHNLLVACLSASYALHHRLDNPGRWFCAGLLHDIGRLVLICHDPIRYKESISYASERNIDLSLAEEAVFEHSHSAIGEQLLLFWNLPSDFADAARGHHDPFERIDHYASGVGVCNKKAHDLLVSGPQIIQPYPHISSDFIPAAIDMFVQIRDVSGCRS